MVLRTSPLFFTICILAQLFLLRSIAFTQTGNPGILIWPLRLHPSLTTKGERVSNLLLTEKNEKAELRTTITPALDVELPFLYHQALFKLGYKGDIILHNRYSRENTMNNQFHVDLNFSLPAGLSLDLSHQFSDNSTQAYSERGRKKDYQVNETSANIGYKYLDRYQAELTYTRTDRKYDWELDQEDDYAEDALSFILSYRIRPRTILLLEPRYAFRDNKDLFGPSTDNDMVGLFIGLERDPAERISGSLKAGYLALMYKEDVWDNVTGFGVEADLNYRPRSYTNFSLKGFRRIAQTSFTSKQGTQYGPSYTSTGIEFSAKHSFTSKISANAQVSYITDTYSETGIVGRKRNDEYWRAEIAIEYKIQEWLSCNLKGSFSDNNSNFPREEYQQSGITFNFVTHF